MPISISVLDALRIKTVHLPAFRNEEHWQFMTDTHSLVSAAGAQTLNIDQLFTVFSELFTLETKSIETVKKSKLTSTIAEVDTRRDSYYRGLVLQVEANSHNSDPARRQASANLQIVLNKYGDFRDKSYNEETAAIYNLLADLNAQCAEDITALAAQQWIKDLDDANYLFDSLMAERFDEQAKQDNIPMRATRTAIDKVYSQMTERINALVLVNGPEQYYDFVNKLNGRIDYFNNTVAARKGRAAAREEGGKKQKRDC